MFAFDPRCFVVNVIPINDKLRLARNKQAEAIRKRKILAVQKVFQCTRCAFKCEKCGRQVTPVDPGAKAAAGDRHVPYCFCDSCSEEYIDYIERLKGGGDKTCYWHNYAWRDAWQAWISYRGALDSYLKSTEFLRLINEIKQNRPDS